ncbi:hypothetical protein IQ06DRAFT_307166 [Phaeosphaeriaceae sp. SRC1lsM3a]|nr:hypothetical protein IQ06DRAFT_307166 [Stagonospora sp. SRC1lsM3a]
MQLVLTPQILPLSNSDLCISVSAVKGVERHDSTQKAGTTEGSYSPQPLTFPNGDQDVAEGDVDPHLHGHPITLLDPPKRTLCRPRRPASLYIPPHYKPTPRPLSTTSLSTIPNPFGKLSFPTAQSKTKLSTILTGPTGALSTVSLQTGPSGYVYTPTFVRVPGYESLRDDHGITFTRKRDVVGKALVRLGIVGDEDARQMMGLRGLARELWDEDLKRLKVVDQEEEKLR